MTLSLAELPLFAGALLALSLAAPPGPANALIALEASRGRYFAGVATGMGAITADFLMFGAIWLGVLRFLDLIPGLIVLMGAVGTLLMGKYAWDAYKAARRPAAVAPDARGGFLKTFFAILTSPFNYAWWLSAGTAVFANVGVWMVAGFFAGLLLWVCSWSALAYVGGRRVRRFATFVGYASAIILAFFAAIVLTLTVTEARLLLAT